MNRWYYCYVSSVRLGIFFLLDCLECCSLRQSYILGMSRRKNNNDYLNICIQVIGLIFFITFKLSYPVLYSSQLIPPKCFQEKQIHSCNYWSCLLSYHILGLQRNRRPYHNLLLRYHIGKLDYSNPIRC